jgi:hypothetical protein
MSFKVEWVAKKETGFDFNPKVYVFHIHEKEVMQCNEPTVLSRLETGKISD